MGIDYITINKEKVFSNKTKYNKNNYSKNKLRKCCHICRIYGHLTRDSQYNMKINIKIIISIIITIKKLEPCEYTEINDNFNFEDVRPMIQISNLIDSIEYKNIPKN